MSVWSPIFTSVRILVYAISVSVVFCTSIVFGQFDSFENFRNTLID
jgi:hypothetical protein